MAFKIKTTEEVANFLKSFSNMVEGENSNYYYIPYWFASTENPEEFEVITFEKIPDDLKERVRKAHGITNEK